MIALRSAAATDTGVVRTNNEDTALAEEPLFAVADGMGGHAAGEVASRVAIDAFREAAGQGLVEAVVAANRAVLARAEQDPALRGMGTTLCALTLLHEDEAGSEQIEIVNVGDSRGYLMRDGALTQVTEDHNVPAELVREGRLTPAEARVHPRRNIVTRVLGSGDEVEVDRFVVDPFRGDRFLLCSDGLCDELDDDAIADVLRLRGDPGATADELVRLARQAGGRDNITVVVVDVVDDGGKAADASSALGATVSSRPGVRSSWDEAEHGGGAVADSSASAIAVAARRRFTWRTAAFLLAVAVVLALAGSALWWFGRGSYFVAPDDRGVLTVYRGRPGGVLWIEPTVESKTTVREQDLAEASRNRLDDRKLQPSAKAAVGYAERLPTTTTTAPPTTTTSAVPDSSSTTIAPPP